MPNDVLSYTQCPTQGKELSKCERNVDKKWKMVMSNKKIYCITYKKSSKTLKWIAWSMPCTAHHNNMEQEQKGLGLQIDVSLLRLTDWQDGRKWDINQIVRKDQPLSNCLSR